ncbi:MAG: L,D-transpeptidase family protein [Alphaproteobacteria bacterium]|nr:L,D-transpeptidase family protein [Alphaproteobacteria bacterium]NNF25015.1 L,D-transpeptidase family protein [Paracoccaceae bacterium]
MAAGLTQAARAARRILSLAALVLAVAACAGTSSLGEQTRPPPVSPFQAQLNRSGIPYTVPPEGKAILVNIPAFELVAFEDGMPVFRSKVIIGTPENPTPRLETHTTLVRFRPSWRPTPDMVASGEYPDKVWPAGPGNPLGLAAIRMEPGLLVYLHDTNRRDFFALDYRALSHGCIRVERWDELIAWLLDWPRERVHLFANGRGTVDVKASRVPVTLGYLTTFPDASGQLLRHPDLYGYGAPQVSGRRAGTALLQDTARTSVLAMRDAGGCSAAE